MRKLFYTSIVFLLLFSIYSYSKNVKHVKESEKLHQKKSKIFHKAKPHPTQLGKSGTISVLGLTFEGFESDSFPPVSWKIGNPDADVTWAKSTTAGGFGNSTSSATMNFYDYSSTNEKDTLYSPILTGLQNGDKLKFDVAYARYTDGSADSLRVVLSTNGGSSFSKIYQKGGALLQTAPATDNSFIPASTQWRTDSVSLPSSVVGVNVVIGFIGINGFSNNLYIDNIKIGTTPQKDLALTSVVMQPSPLVVGTNAQVIAGIRWEGTQTRPSSVRVNYKIGSSPADSNDGISEVFFPAWAGSPPSATISFSVPINPSSGNFTLYVKGFQSGDGFSSNDVVSKTFFATFVVNTFPYFENFDENSDSGWAAGSIGSTVDWVRATPAKGNPATVQIDNAYSGTKCWITKASGNYSDLDNTYVVSPIFNFSSLTTVPIINFYHNYSTETGFDGGTLEYSINGSAFGILGNFEDINGFNWFDNDEALTNLAGPNWSGSSEALEDPDSGWINSRLPLTDFIGQSNVQFRFRFVSDEATNDQGWAFDNVYLYGGASISGQIYNDINGNGSFDLGDSTLPDVEVDLFGPENRVTYSDSLGNYKFDFLQPGIYIDSLASITGSVVTSTHSYSISANANLNNGKDFGVFKLGSISGINFFRCHVGEGSRSKKHWKCNSQGVVLLN